MSKRRQFKTEAMFATQAIHAMNLSVLWRIENLSFWKREFHGETISSAVFPSLYLIGDAWNLRMFPQGQTNMLDSRMIYAELESLNAIQSFQPNCRWELLDRNYACVLRGNVQTKAVPVTFFGNATQSRIKFELHDFPTYEDIFVTRKASYLPNDTLTLQLCFGSSPQIKHVSLVSKIEVAEESFKWHIKQFTSLQLGQEVETPFYLDFSQVREIYKLKFSLTGASLNEAKFKFEIVSENANEQLFNAVVSVLNNKQEATICATDEHTFHSSVYQQSWILNSAWNTETLGTTSDLLCGEDLILHFKFSVVLKEYHYSIEYNKLKNKNDNSSGNSSVVKINNDKNGDNPISKTIASTILEGSAKTLLQCVSQQKRGSMTVLGKDLLSLYQDHTMSDFEIHSGDVSFPVHKNILCARSPVFKAMFSSDMTESGSDSMDVPDLDVHTLGRMLTFLYAETIDDDLEYESAEKLYYAADKYQIPSLKEECLPVLRSNITVSNVCNLLELADRHHDKELMSWVHDFIQDHFHEVINTVEWDKFLRRSYLGGITMKEVCSKMASRKSK